jgi:hypothetical protein
MSQSNSYNLSTIKNNEKRNPSMKKQSNASNSKLENSIVKPHGLGEINTSMTYGSKIPTANNSTKNPSG